MGKCQYLFLAFFTTPHCAHRPQTRMEVSCSYRYSSEYSNALLLAEVVVLPHAHPFKRSSTSTKYYSQLDISPSTSSSSPPHLPFFLVDTVNTILKEKRVYKFQISTNDFTNMRAWFEIERISYIQIKTHAKLH